MANLVSTLTVSLTDDVSGKAARAANALRSLGASGADLKKLAGAAPETAKLVRELERLQALAGKVDAFKGASAGAGQLGGQLRKAREEVARTARDLAAAERKVAFFDRSRNNLSPNYAGFVRSGEVAAADARLKAARKAEVAAKRGAAELERAYETQRQAARAVGAELGAAGVDVRKLGAAEAGLKGQISAVNAELARQPALLAAAASGADRLGKATDRLAKGMSAAGQASGRMDRISAGMASAGRAERAARERASADARIAVEAAAARAAGRREALGTIGAGAGLYAGHQAKNIGRQSVLAVADYDHAVRSQEVYTDVSERDQAEVLIPQALRIGQETKFSNVDVIKAQTASMQGLPASFDGRLKAEVAQGIVENVKYYATLMDVDLKDGAETIRAYLQATGKDISTKEKALTEAQTAVNQIVKMAKLGGMNGEDASQYVKYAAASSTAAGLSSDRMLALGALARRGGLRGDEAGVFMRSAASKLVAPTREGIAAMTAAGVNHSEFVKMPERLSTDALESQFRNKMGKGFTPEIRKRLDEINGDAGLIGDRSKYTEAVTQAVGDILGKKKDGTVRASDARVAAKAAGEFHKLSAQEVDTNGLLEALGAKKMTAAQLNAMFTDKHGGKFSLTQKQWDEFFASLKEVRKAGNDPNFAKDRSDKVMAGIYGSFENLKGSVENFYLAVGKANEGLLKFAFDGLGNAIDLFSKMPKGAQQATSLGAGAIALVAALRGAYVLTKNLLGFGSAAALGGSAAALSGSAAALDGAAAALTRAALVPGAKGTVPAAAPVAAPVAGGLVAAGVVGAVAAGGVGATIAANEAVKNKDFAAPYLEGGMLGADPAGYGLGAAIQQADTLPGADHFSGKVAAPVAAAEVREAVKSVAELKAELAGVEQMLTGLQASGEAAFSPDASGLEAKKAALEASIDALLSKSKAVGEETIAPKADASGLDPLAVKFGEIRDKAGEVNGLTIRPQADGSGLGTIITQLDTIISKASQANAAVGSVKGAVSGGGGGNSGAVRAAAGNNH